MRDLEIRKEICEIGKALYDKGLVDSCGGNISVRDGNKIYIVQRKSGAEKRWLINEDSILVTDLCMRPIYGDIEKISREAPTHYYVYQNFSDINAVIHAHPLYMMVFGSAHMDIPPVSECTRARIGNQPIENIEESLPGSIEQAKNIVENFRKRRQINPNAELICNLPFHGSFAAGYDLNAAFMITEIADNCAKILIYRQLMFGNNPKADFKIRKVFNEEEEATVEEVKEVCMPGATYRDAYGNEVVYGKDNNQINEKEYLIKRVTEEILKKIKS